MTSTSNSRDQQKSPGLPGLSGRRSAAWALLVTLSPLAFTSPAMAGSASATEGSDGPSRQNAAAGAVQRVALEDQSQSRDGGGLDEIIVTANKRPENVQKVPISVAVVSGQRLANTGTVEVQNLQAVVPGLQIAPLGNASQTIVRIRGIGTTGINSGFESAVGVFVDGVFRSRAGQALGSFLDLSRVEVLRGPQGTLFGKNTTAGAINIISNAPAHEFGGSFEASVGNYSSRRVTGMLTGPIAEGVSFRLAGTYQSRDGTFAKLGPGVNPTVVDRHYYNDRNRGAVRGQLLFEPSTDLSIRFIGDYSKSRERGAVGQFLSTGAVTQLGLASGAIGIPQGTPAGSVGLNGLGAYLQPANHLGDRQAQLNIDPYDNVRDYGLAAEVIWKLGGAKLTSITAYRDYLTRHGDDLDLTGADIFGPFNEGEGIRSATQEFQLSGNSDKLQWLVGTYLFDEQLDFFTNISIGRDFGPFVGLGFPSGAFLNQGIRQTSHQSNRGISVFTQGFVDIHAHYDGQATWDDLLSPSSSHGVTTVVMGNCGVGFAPIRQELGAREDLINLMEGVEDIPGTALWEGIDWSWESFTDYLDLLGERAYSMDVATLIPHGPLRLYIMGDRGARQEAATREDVQKMAALAAEAVREGAFGFSTSRILSHQSMTGDRVPGTFASDDELGGIGEAVAREGGLMQLAAGGGTGTGGLDMASDRCEEPLETELSWMEQLSRRTGMTISFLLGQSTDDPQLWRRAIDICTAANQGGAMLRPQVGARAVGMLLTLDGRHVFERRPTYIKLAHLPLAERVAEMRNPDVRRTIVSEADTPDPSIRFMDQVGPIAAQMLDGIFPMGNPVAYDPTPDQSVARIAVARGVTPQEAAYELLLEDDGQAVLMFPGMNYVDRNEDALFDMLSSPTTILSLADGGAHCGITCDGSLPTYMLAHWANGRTRGPRLSIEAAVRKQTSDTASAFGFTDRGTIEVGKRADLNVIDFNRLSLGRPYIVRDLPAGGSRIMQEADGYRATVCAGKIVRRDDRDTGARPGRLVRRGTIGPVSNT